MQIVIRPPGPQDLSGIEQVFSDSWREESGKVQADEVKYWTGKVEEAVSGRSNINYLVAANHKICGIIGWRGEVHALLKPFAKKKAVELYDLFISKECQGQGVGRELMQAFLSEAGKTYEEVIFLSAERWKDAWPFYDKLGFKRVGNGVFPGNKTTFQVFQKDL